MTEKLRIGRCEAYDDVLPDPDGEPRSVRCTDLGVEILERVLPEGYKRYRVVCVGHGLDTAGQVSPEELRRAGAWLLRAADELRDALVVAEVHDA